MKKELSELELNEVIGGTCKCVCYYMDQDSSDWHTLGPRLNKSVCREDCGALGKHWSMDSCV